MSFVEGSYGDRLARKVAERGALCVGVDPSREVMAAWGLGYDVRGLETVAMTMVEAVGDLVATMKPQSAFFEAHGSAGVAVLERTVAAAQAHGALVVLDVKRGDIGSTMAAYADAYLADGSPLAADAVTLSPYLGFGSLQPAFDRAHATGRGVYVLARTSNPEGGAVQLSTGAQGRTVVQSMVDAAVALNAATGQGAVGLVVGANLADIGCDLSRFDASVLAPGIGAQGGRLDDVRATFGDQALVLPSASREVMAAGPDPERLRAKVRAMLSGE